MTVGDYRIILNSIDEMTVKLDEAIAECELLRKAGFAFSEAENCIGRAKYVILSEQSKIEMMEVPK